jgi:hypothetical protein
MKGNVRVHATPPLMSNESLSRRRFLSSLTIVAGGIAAVSIMPGCAASADAGLDENGDELDVSEEDLKSCSKTSTTIGTNHGHTLTVSEADINAGVSKTYTLGGSHAHTVTLTAANFATLKSTGKLVTASSADLGHSHSVTVGCTGPTVVTGAPTLCKTSGPSAIIGANHGHTLAIRAADVAAAVAKSYSIAGGAGHDHVVNVSPANFKTLRTKGTLTIKSAIGAGHSHSVTLTCA